MILAQNWPKTANSSWHCSFNVQIHSTTWDKMMVRLSCDMKLEGTLSARKCFKIWFVLSVILGPPGLPGAAGPPAPPPMPGPCPVVCTHTCIRSCPPPCCRRWVPEDKLRLSDPVALVYNSLRMEFTFSLIKWFFKTHLFGFCLSFLFH